MRRPLWYVRPGSLALIGAVLAAFMLVAALLETRNTRNTLLMLVAEKGRIAANQIEQGAVLALRAMDEAEKNLASRLQTVAGTTVRMEEVMDLDHEALAELAKDNRVHAIHLITPDGRMHASSKPSAHFEHQTPPDFRERFSTLFSGEDQESVLGLHFSPADGGARFAVGARRRGGGIVVCSMDAGALLELRKTFGLGRLIQDVGQVHGVSYVMIQDEEGILTATPNISGARKILDDPFLADLWEGEEEATRKVSFEGRDVFEVIKTISIDSEHLGLLRVAFDLDEVQALEQKSRRRLLITILVLTVLGIIALNAVVIYQNMNLAVRARDEMSTFSGAVLSGMADGVLVVSDEGKVALANDVARVLFGRQIHRLPQKLQSLVEETLQKSTPVAQQLEIKGEDGRQRLLTLSASRVRVPGEDVPYTVIILRDVTEEQRLKETIQRSEKITAQGRLAAAVAHEVRNPLNAIGMTAQRLRAEFEPRKDTEEYRRFLDVIRTEIGRLDNIITQFLRFASEPQIKPGKQDVGELIDSVITQVAGQASGSGVRIVSDVPEGLTAVMDSRQMRQVLLNLVTNALESMEDKGEIRLSAEQEGPWVQIAVEDDGAGMTQEELKQAFELHFTTKEKGTGLGLSISQRIVERHGGFLTLECRDGCGTKARIRIPKSFVGADA